LHFFLHFFLNFFLRFLLSVCKLHVNFLFHLRDAVLGLAGALVLLKTRER
jgi:hypothetical protein